MVTEGTGTRAARPEREVAGKTGTTSDYRDAWFLGFSADYVAGVWMGMDDNSIMGGKVTGGGLPAEIWRETMLRVHQGLPARPLPMQAPVAPTQSQQPRQQPHVSQEDNDQRTRNAVDGVLRGLLGLETR